MPLSQPNYTTLNFIVFLGLALIPLGYWIFRTGKTLSTRLDATWKKHVESLRAQGIDPSYIKRTPEWEHAQIKDAKIYMGIGIFVATIVPIIVIGLAIVGALR